MTTVGTVYGKFLELLIAAGWKCESHSPGVPPIQRVAIFKRKEFELRVERSDTITTVSDGTFTYGFDSCEFDGRYFIVSNSHLQYCQNEQDVWASFEEFIY